MEEQLKHKTDLIIKLGGSAITRKDRLETVNCEALETAGKLISTVWRQKLRLIICHGAGSFGHSQAKEFNVNYGYSDLSRDEADKVKEGFSVTRISVTKLNQLVVEKLVSIGLPAVALSPCGVWKTSNGEVIQHGVGNVCDLLNDGFIPVIHGDCVLDTHKCCTILSGDTIIKTLCSELDVDRVVFLSDVNGVYDRPPLDTDAQLLPEVFINKDGTIPTQIDTDLNPVDVTGGIKLKLHSASDIVYNSKGRTKVFICNINSKEAEYICFHGVKSSIGNNLSTVLTLNT